MIKNISRQKSLCSDVRQSFDKVKDCVNECEKNIGNNYTKLLNNKHEMLNNKNTNKLNS